MLLPPKARVCLGAWLLGLERLISQLPSADESAAIRSVSPFVTHCVCHARCQAPMKMWFRGLQSHHKPAPASHVLQVADTLALLLCSAHLPIHELCDSLDRCTASTPSQLRGNPMRMRIMMALLTSYVQHLKEQGTALLAQELARSCLPTNWA